MVTRSKVHELLASDDFRRRTAMFVGTRRFREVSLWLSGYSFALKQLGLPQPLYGDVPGGFSEWLTTRYDKPPALSWESYIMKLRGFGEGEEATNDFLTLWDEFVAETKHQ